MKINVKKVKKNLIKAYATVAVAANTIALNATAFAAEGGGSGAPEGVDTSNYDALLNIIFWAAGILIILLLALVFLDSRRWLKVRLMRISVDLTQVLLP